MSVGCAQVSQELIMPKTHFGRFDHEAVYTFLIFLRVVNPWTICQKMRYVPDLHLYSKVSKLNFENPKKFQKFWKIFFCSNFHLICFRMPKNELWQLFLHVMVIHLIFGTLLIDDIAQNLWIRATYFCTSKAIQKAILMIMVLYWCVIYSKKRINRFSSNKQSFGFFTLQFRFLFCQKFFNSLVLLHCFCTDSTRKAFIFQACIFR